MILQSTRLELVIVGAALLVLLLCRQPPKSGNAGITRDTGLAGQQPALQTPEGISRATGSLPTQTARSLVATPSSDTATSDNRTTDSETPAPPKMKRIGMVDATKCPGLNYKEVMYGEVTVKWVWDGQRMVPRKVCEVREKNGTISTWNFDEPNGVIITEVQPQLDGL
jgi:hypothetical protein